MPRRKRVPRPFLKWAGGKGQLLDQLQELLPRRPFKRFYEPFVGGGAMFFELWARRAARGQPLVATLSDSNEELIDAYKAVRDEVDTVISLLQEHRYEEDYYYRMRALNPEDLDRPQRAARTIFLNKTGFNGLYRVNKSGKFNVPFGRYANPLICDEKNLRACSAALSDVTLEVSDYARVLEDAEKGDFVYLDPPYSPLSDTASFTAYIPGGFDWDEQLRLAATFAKLRKRGVLAMLSNSDVRKIRRLYKPIAQVIRDVRAARRINSKGDKRGEIGELVVLSYKRSGRR